MKIKIPAGTVVRAWPHYWYYKGSSLQLTKRDWVAVAVYDASRKQYRVKLNSEEWASFDVDSTELGVTIIDLED